MFLKQYYHYSFRDVDIVQQELVCNLLYPCHLEFEKGGSYCSLDLIQGSTV